MTLPISSCEAEKNFLNLHNKKQILISYARGKTQLFFYDLYKKIIPPNL